MKRFSLGTDKPTNLQTESLPALGEDEITEVTTSISRKCQAWSLDCGHQGIPSALRWRYERERQQHRSASHLRWQSSSETSPAWAWRLSRRTWRMSVDRFKPHIGALCCFCCSCQCQGDGFAMVIYSQKYWILVLQLDISTKNPFPQVCTQPNYRQRSAQDTAAPHQVLPAKAESTTETKDCLSAQKSDLDSTLAGAIHMATDANRVPTASRKYCRLQ